MEPEQSPCSSGDEVALGLPHQGVQVTLDDSQHERGMLCRLEREEIEEHQDHIVEPGMDVHSH